MLNVLCLNEFFNRLFFVQDDKLVFDLSFRDCLNVMNRLEMRVAMPSFFNGKKQFDVRDVNRSR